MRSEEDRKKLTSVRCHMDSAGRRDITSNRQRALAGAINPNRMWRDKVSSTGPPGGGGGGRRDAVNAPRLSVSPTRAERSLVATGEFSLPNPKDSPPSSTVSPNPWSSSLSSASSPKPRCGELIHKTPSTKRAE
jgi:hypothetical protein